MILIRIISTISILLQLWLTGFGFFSFLNISGRLLVYSKTYGMKVNSKIILAVEIIGRAGSTIFITVLHKLTGASFDYKSFFLTILLGAINYIVALVFDQHYVIYEKSTKVIAKK